MIPPAFPAPFDIPSWSEGPNRTQTHQSLLQQTTTGLISALQKPHISQFCLLWHRELIRSLRCLVGRVGSINPRPTPQSDISCSLN